MDSTTIELKVLYGRDLKVSNYFQKPVVFVEVSIAGDEVEQSRQQVQRTTTVREGDGQPEWNQEMRFELTEAMLGDRDHLFLQFDLRHEGLVFGDKPIGEVRVPFTHLFEESNGIVRFVSYEVRSPDGKANGSLNFSYKVNLKGGGSVGEMNSPPSAANITGYPTHFSNPGPYLAYPAQSFDAGAYPIGHEIGYSPSPVVPLAHEIGYSSSPGAPHGHEIGYSLSPGAPYSSQDAHYQAPEHPNGYYPSAPMTPAPPVAVAIHRHHHYHGPPPANPWVSDPRGYGYGYSPRGWAPGGTDGYSSPSSWSGR